MFHAKIYNKFEVTVVSMTVTHSCTSGILPSQERLRGHKQQGDTDQNKFEIALVTVVPAHQVFTLTGRLRGYKATR